MWTGIRMIKGDDDNEDEDNVLHSLDLGIVHINEDGYQDDQG